MVREDIPRDRRTPSNFRRAIGSAVGAIFGAIFGGSRPALGAEGCGDATALLPSSTMARTMRFGLTGILVAEMLVAIVGGALAGGCGSSSPVDIHLGTDLGADFRAPVTDAAGDATVDAPAGAGGAGGLGGAAGAGGDAGSGGIGGVGQAGAGAAGAGAAGTGGAAGNVAGSGGGAGAGS
jgi:hypothetical protein